MKQQENLTFSLFIFVSIKNQYFFRTKPTKSWI